MMKSQPIGIFDSGVGGLSVAQKIRELLPNENLIYIADSFHAPYGDKSEEFIIQRSNLLTRFLVEQGAKIIVVACNTATVSTIRKLRDTFDLPIVGIEPGVKPAAESSQTGVIGILATERTLKSESFNQLAKRFDKTTRVETQACPGFVEQVERLELNNEKTIELVNHHIHTLLDKGVDTIVLGCTHYPFLLPLIKKATPKNMIIIDTGLAVAKEVRRRLNEQELLSTQNTNGESFFYSSGSLTEMEGIISKLWGAHNYLKTLE